MRFLAVLPCVCLAAALYAPPCSAQTHYWSHRFGDASTYQWTGGIAADASGNVVHTGGFSSTLDFGGGLRTSAGGHDYYIAKFDRHGAWLWDRQFGDAGDQYELFGTVDASGNILVVGDFSGSVDFGGGALTSAGPYDICVAKLDPNGNHIWSRRYGDANDQRPRAIAVDEAGNVAITGHFSGSVDFGGGALTSAGADDIFVAEFDTNGSHMWSHGFGDASPQVAESVAFDAAGNVLLGGYFYGTVDFGGGPLISAGDRDVFVAKFAPNGTLSWSQRFGDAASQTARGVGADDMNNVLLTGGYIGTVNFGGGALTAEADDMFLAKFGATGNHLWSNRFGDGSAIQTGTRVTADGEGNVYATGYFRGSVNFGGGWLPNTGGYEDMFLAKFGSAGNHLWSRGYGDNVGQVQSWALAVDDAGDALAAGQFTWTVNFGGGQLSSAGGWDIFHVKFSVASALDITTAAPDSIGPNQAGSLDLDVRDAQGVRLGGRAADLQLTSTSGFVCSFDPPVENPDKSYTVGYTTCSQAGLDNIVATYAGVVPPISDSHPLLVTHYPDAVVVDVDPPRRVRAGQSIPVRVSILNRSGARVPDERTALVLQSLTGLGSVTSLSPQSDSSYTAEYQAGPVASFERLEAFDADAATIQRDSVTIEVTTRPVVLSVLDIGNDQGRQVRVTWERDLHDAEASGTPITEYVVWRRIDPLAKAGAQVLPLQEMERILAQPESGGDGRLLLGLASALWEPVGPRVPGMMWPEYASVVPTLADSTIASGMHYSVFCVSAHTQSPQVFYVSDPDSGWSIDNLAPAAPANLVYTEPGWLSWDEAPEADFDYFSVYASWKPALDETAELLGATTATSMDIRTELHAYYFVTATDFSGNEGPPAHLDEPVGSEVMEIPSIFALSAGRPNPFRSSVRLEFSLPHAASVRLEVYDVAGRRVRTLVDAARPAGRHRISWHGVDDRGEVLPAGVYFCRLEADDHRTMRKLVLLSTR